MCHAQEQHNWSTSHAIRDVRLRSQSPTVKQICNQLLGAWLLPSLRLSAALQYQGHPSFFLPMSTCVSTIAPFWLHTAGAACSAEVPEAVVRMAASRFFSACIDALGQVWTFGGGYNGELGHSTAWASSATRVSGEVQRVSCSTEDVHA